ncbi:MAG: hypothetical protein AAFU71_13900, partial [Cyanobacteria bacterium J06632_22]
IQHQADPSDRQSAIAPSPERSLPSAADQPLQRHPDSATAPPASLIPGTEQPLTAPPPQHPTQQPASAEHHETQTIQRAATSATPQSSTDESQPSRSSAAPDSDSASPGNAPKPTTADRPSPPAIAPTSPLQPPTADTPTASPVTNRIARALESTDSAKPLPDPELDSSPTTAHSSTQAQPLDTTIRRKGDDATSLDDEGRPQLSPPPTLSARDPSDTPETARRPLDSPTVPEHIQRQGLGQGSGRLPAVTKPENQPQTLQPLGVLRALPPLSDATPRKTENLQRSAEKEGTPSSPLAGQPPAVPGQWSNLASLVAQLGGTPAAGNGALQRQRTDGKPSPTPTPQDSDRVNIQRQANAASAPAPQQWSNLQDLVMRLQDDDTAAKSTPASSANPPFAKSQTEPQAGSRQAAQPNAKPNTQPSPDPAASTPSASPIADKPKPVIVDNPPAVTIRRQTTSSQPVVVQACCDPVSATSSDSDKANDTPDDVKDYSRYLELLAQEVYSLLRQRLSLEQERRGPRYPR